MEWRQTVQEAIIVCVGTRSCCDDDVAAAAADYDDNDDDQDVNDNCRQLIDRPCLANDRSSGVTRVGDTWGGN